MSSQPHLVHLPKELGSLPPTDLEQGLTNQDAQKRLSQFGYNTIPEEKVSFLGKLKPFFWGPIPWMIEIAAILSIIAHDITNFCIITFLLIVNAFAGFFEEYKSANAIQALKKELALQAYVLRDGQWEMIPAEQLVPGDIIQLHLGNIVPADAILVDGQFLSVDQSLLTGESLPVSKKKDDTVYSGSIVHQGEMKAIVTQTGTKTFFGKTIELTGKAEKPSHYQKAILNIGKYLIIITLCLATLVLGIALLRGNPFLQILSFVLVLIVAAIPVALPTVLSVTLAIGATQLAKMKAIVSRLVSIEEMAGMNVLCVDKTGTLTKNELTIGNIIPIEENDTNAILLFAALTSNVNYPDDQIEKTIIDALHDKGDITHYHIEKYTPFDPVHKYSMANVINAQGERISVIKGAPQVVLEKVNPPTEIKNIIDEKIQELASKGYRSIAVAKKDSQEKWTFLGIIPLFDPPRDDSTATIEAVKEKGLSLKMLTGDHTAIAKQIAKTLGLGEKVYSTKGFASEKERYSNLSFIDNADAMSEVTPEDKYQIVKYLQSKNNIVGMTGDGVNDAPALKQADVGIAVSGATDAAKAAADLVLTAPGLGTIVRAIYEARKIFGRMLSYATFRISETIRVLLFVTISIIVFNFYPVTTIMIVMLALLNDIPIMMISYDNTILYPKPVRWNMRFVLALSTVLGILGLIESFFLLFLARDVLGIEAETIRTLIFLKLLVAGHMTLFLTRTPYSFWKKPWPSYKLLVALESTQVFGTLIAVYGYFMAPIGWLYALAIWGYAFLWLVVENYIKLAILSKLKSLLAAKPKTYPA